MVQFDNMVPVGQVKVRDGNFDADCIVVRRDAEPAERLSPLEREVLRDIVMVTAGFVLIIAAIILGLSA